MRVSGYVLPVFLLLGSCGPPRPPAAPDVPPDLPPGLAGVWKCEPHGIILDLMEDGRFTWTQGKDQRAGTFEVDGPWLVMVSQGRYTTKYAIVQLEAGALTLRDPAGTQVSFTGETSGEPAAVAETGGPEKVQGVWANTTFAVRIELAGDASFVWKQGDLVETGTWSVEGDAIHMTTGGHTSSYRIVSLSESEMVLLDPAGNELGLARSTAEPAGTSPEPIGKEALLAGAPPIKIVDLGKGGSKARLEPIVSPSGQSRPAAAVVARDGIFHFVPPEGWTVDEQKVCGNKFTAGGMKYTCWSRNDLYTPDNARIHFEMSSFATWAAPGALEKVSPSIDAMLAAYDQDRTSVSDDLSEMLGFEVFSTRLEGRAGSTMKQLRGRIVGIHYGDMLLVGVLALTADPETLAKWGTDVEATLDSMGFHFQAGEDLESSIEGTWLGGGSSWSFWSDSTYVRGGEAGSWMVVGSALFMAEDPLGEGELGVTPVRLEDEALVVGDLVLKKQE